MKIPLPEWFFFLASMIRRGMLGLILSICTVAGANATTPLAIDIGGDTQRLAVWPQLRVVVNADRPMNLDQVAALALGENALTVISPERIFGRGSVPHWGYFLLENAGEHTRERLLALEATTLFDVRLFEKDGLGNWVEINTWAQNAQGSFGGGTIYPVWALELTPKSTKEMLIKIEGPSIVRFPVFVYSPEKFALVERKFHVLAGVTLGIFIFIGVYIASLRGQLNDASVPLFAVILLADLLGTFWLSGILSELFPSAPEKLLSPIGFAAYCTLFGGGAWHARLYLNTRQWAPQADRLLYGLGWLWLFLATWVAWAYPVGARILLVWGGTATAIVVVAISVMAARRQILFSKYEAAIWMTSLVFVMSYLLSRAFNQPLLWSSSALALVQATVIAVLYGVAMSSHLLRQRALLESSQKEAVLERERLNVRINERSLIYAATNHDLRQPLLGVSVFADLLTSAETSEKRRAYANNLNMALREVDDILVSMQQLAALNESVRTPPLEQVSLNEILTPLIEEYRTRAQAKHINIRYVPTQLRIDTHVQYFQRIVRNALTNAIRHGGHGCRILVGVRRGGGLRLMIVDTGPGMTQAQTQKAFDAFASFDPRGPLNKGAGLGLFSSQSLANLLGLKVSLQSQEGRGTVFALQIAAVAAGEHVRLPHPTDHHS